jgi:hypothetical protein
VQSCCGDKKRSFIGRRTFEVDCSTAAESRHVIFSFLAANKASLTTRPTRRATPASPITGAGTPSLFVCFCPIREQLMLLDVSNCNTARRPALDASRHHQRSLRRAFPEPSVHGPSNAAYYVWDHAGGSDLAFSFKHGYLHRSSNGKLLVTFITTFDFRLAPTRATVTVLFKLNPGKYI